MLAVTGVVFLALSVAAFFLRLQVGAYSRYPYEQFVLVGAAFVTGLASAIANPGFVSFGLLAVEAIALAMVVRFFGIGERFPNGEVGVKTGERFPDFTLPDSEGRLFHSRMLSGSAAALYISYRGHF